MKRLLTLLSALLILPSVYSQCLTGTYTVGLNGNYGTLAAAVTALKNNGVCGPVEFLLKDGTYTEEIIIPTITGSSGSNVIVFTSQSGDATKVTLTSMPYTELVKVSNASYITFSHLTIEPKSTYGFFIERSSNINLRNLIFKGKRPYPPTHVVFIGDTWPSYSCNTNEVADCIFLDGVGVSVNTASNLSVKRNRFYNTTTAILLSSAIESTFSDNFIISDRADANSGFYILERFQGTQIKRNEVIFQGCDNCLPFFIANGNYSDPAGEISIHNNIFNTYGGASYSAVDIRDSKNVKFNFNTVSISHRNNGVNQYSRGVAFDNVENAEFMNNIVINKAGGVGLSYWRQTYTPSITTDYNNYYTNSNKIIHFLGFNYATISEWQINERDLHSTQIDPQFISPENLRIYRADALENHGVSLAQITTDVDGEERGTMPDIGADEFTYVPSALDAGLILPGDFRKAFCYGKHAITAQVKNFGTVPITSFEAKVMVDGVEYPYSWNGVINVGQTSPLITFRQHFFDERIHRVTVQLTSLNGAADGNTANNVQSFEILNYRKPGLSLGGTPQLCRGEVVTLISGEGVSTWSTGQQDDEIVVGEAGQYWFDHTVDGCVSRSDSVNVTVNNNVPVIAISYSNTGQTLSIANTSKNATAYEWNYGDDNTGSGPALETEHIYATPGDYDITVKATNGQCTVTEVKAYTIADLTSVNCIVASNRIADVVEKGDYLYVGGSTHFDPTDAYVAKINKYTKAVIWSWTYHREQQDKVRDIEVDALGNVYATLFSDFSLSSLVKLNSNGQQVYMKTVSNNNLENIYDYPPKTVVKVDASNNVYFVNTRNNFTVEKFSPDGTSLWFRQNPTTRFAIARDAVLDNEGNIIVLATESQVVWETLTLTKFDSNGNVLYNVETPERTDDQDVPYSLYLQGTSTYSFATNSSSKTFVLKKNANGSTAWSYKISETVRSLAHYADAQGNAYMLYLKGEYADCYLLKIDNTGQVAFEKKVDYVYESYGYAGAITVDSDGFIYCSINESVHKYTPTGTRIYTDNAMPLAKKLLVMDNHALLVAGMSVHYNQFDYCGLVILTQAEHRKTQTIQIASTLSGTYGTTIPIAVSASSGGPVILKSDNAQVVAVDGNTIILTGAGTATITATQIGNNSYQPASSETIVTVSKAPLQILADNKTKTYGTANPTLTMSVSGFVSGDDISKVDALPSVSTQATSASRVGAHAITLAGGADNNYEFVKADGILTITKAQLIVTADNKFRAYKNPNPAFTLSFNGFVNGDTPGSIDVLPSISTAAVLASKPGTYALVSSGGSDSDYEIVHQNGTLTISKSPLIVTAEDKTKVFGQANPPLTLRYEGFFEGETSSSLDVIPSASTVANQSSSVGQYAINLSGGTDDLYELILRQGKLTVTPAPQHIVFDEIENKLVGQSTFKISATASSGLPVIFTTASPSISIAGDVVTIGSAGRVTIIASQPGSLNYLPADPVSQSFDILLLTDLENPLKTAVSVFPNPSSKYLHVDVPAQKMQMKVVSTAGLVMESYTLSAGENVIDVSHWVQGLYLILLSDSTGKFTYSTKLEKR